MHFFASVLALATFLTAQSTYAAEDVSKLIEQLGDASYLKREAAVEALLKLGFQGESALKQGLKHKDLEVRRWCKKLILKIRSAELQRKIDYVLSDKKGTRKIDLPGWDRYQKLVGNDLPARKFFIDMLLLDRTLLASVEGKPKEISERLAARAQALYETIYPPGGFVGGRRPTLKTSEVGLLLLLSSHPEVKFPRAQVYRFTSFFYQSSIRNEIRSSKKSPFRRLFVGWLGNVSDELVLGQLMQQATSWNIPEMGQIAEKIMKNDKVKGRAKAVAFTLLAKTSAKNGKKYIPLMEKYLTSKENICSFSMGRNLRGTTQVRDVALAMILTLTGQNHSDYNFTYTRNGNTSKYYQFNASFLGFSSEADRMAALEKWKAWKAANPGKVKG